MYDGNQARGINFGSSYREVRVSEGSNYRESTEAFNNIRYSLEGHSLTATGRINDKW